MWQSFLILARADFGFRSEIPFTFFAEVFLHCDGVAPGPSPQPAGSSGSPCARGRVLVHVSYSASEAGHGRAVVFRLSVPSLSALLLEV
jgi:hypothetical protein